MMKQERQVERNTLKYSVLVKEKTEQHLGASTQPLRWRLGVVMRVAFWVGFRYASLVTHISMPPNEEKSNKQEAFHEAACDH
jgi:hypothetical protein